MHKNVFPLTLASFNKEIELVSMRGGRAVQIRLASMGLNPGVRLKVLQTVKNGPCVILVGTTRLVLGFGIANKILVKVV